MDPIALDIQVDVNGRRILQAAGQQIAIVRVMQGEPVYVVTCAVFSPFGDSNEVAVYPSFKSYVMSGAVQPLGLVKLQLTQTVQPGQQYTFDGATIGYPEPAYSPTVIGLINAAKNVVVSAGLAQRMVVMNADAYRAIAISGFPYNAASYYEPTTTVLVFLVSGVDEGEILPVSILRPAIGFGHGAAPEPGGFPETIGGYLEVDLTADAVIHFDAIENCFRPGPLSGK